MAKDRSKPLSEINFHCKACRLTFEAEPARVLDAPAQEHHPFEYFADCPTCAAECAQVHWERSLLKAYVNATGPRTAEGKAATAANLEGHPTKDEALRTRYNAMKHGLSARTATYFPAKPGKYPHCKGCDVDHVFCAQQPACVKKTELFMLHHAAFDQKNPKHLMGIYSDLQSAVFAVLQGMLQSIIATGAEIRTPEFTFIDGRCTIAQYTYRDANGEEKSGVLTKLEVNPLIKAFGELMSRTSLSLSDMGMTAKVIEADEAEMGKLNNGSAQREELGDYQRRQVEALEGLRSVMDRAGQSMARDPVLIEHKEQMAGDNG